MEQEFAAVHDGLLGDQIFMTPGPPILVNDRLVGGKALECTGIQGIKGTRCYTSTLSHQHPHHLIGITASAKIYNGHMTEMQKIRKHMAAVSYVYFLSVNKF